MVLNYYVKDEGTVFIKKDNIKLKYQDIVKLLMN